MAAAKLSFSYASVGATAKMPPAGYVVDHTRIKLGEGELVFRSAIAALRRWAQLRLGWVEAWPPDTPILAGEVVAVMGRAIGVWWLNACRVVHVVDGCRERAEAGRPQCRTHLTVPLGAEDPTMNG